jgi:hypothetical protein
MRIEPMLITEFLITKTSGITAYSNVHNSTYRIHISSKLILHNGTSALVPNLHSLSGPTPGTPCIGSYRAFRPIYSLQNQFGLHFVTRSGKASLRFLSSLETLYSSCTKSPKGYFSSVLNARNELTSQMYLLINNLHSFKDLYRKILFS